MNCVFNIISMFLTHMNVFSTTLMFFVCVLVYLLYHVVCCVLICVCFVICHCA